jgi:hypothetical protein
VIWPSSVARTMMLPNSDSDVSRPCVLIDSWNAALDGAGGAPRTPAATWTFCSRMARMTSVVVSWRDASRSGSSHTRMLYSPAPKTWTAPTPPSRVISSFTCRCA